MVTNKKKDIVNLNNYIKCKNTVGGGEGKNLPRRGGHGGWSQTDYCRGYQ